MTKSILIAALLAAAAAPSFAAAPDGCRDSSDVLGKYLKDAQRPESEYCNDATGACRRKISEAQRRCSQVAEVADQLKAARDFTALDAAYRKMADAQPKIGKETFAVWLERRRAEDLGIMVTEYEKILDLQKEAGKSARPLGKILTPEEKREIVKRNDQIGAAMATKVARIRSVSQNFADLKGDDIANRFKTIVENGGTYATGDFSGPGGSSAADLRGARVDARVSAAAPARPSVHLDAGLVPAPAEGSAPPAPAGDGRNPLVPLTGVGLVAAGAIGIAYNKYKAAGEQTALNESTARFLADQKLDAVAQNPASPADFSAPAPQAAPPSGSSTSSDQQLREELGRQGIDTTGMTQ